LKYKVLFKGQRKARGSHECDDCGREICPNEHYYTKVVLIYHPEYRREIQQTKSCCRNR
jgi:methionyl-tRNA synthetase